MVIEENGEAFHSDHKVSPTFAEMQSDFAWADNVDALLNMGRTNKEYINSKIPLRFTLHFLEETMKPEAQMADYGLFRRYKYKGT